MKKYSFFNRNNLTDKEREEIERRMEERKMEMVRREEEYKRKKAIEERTEKEKKDKETLSKLQKSFGQSIGKEPVRYQETNQRNNMGRPEPQRSAMSEQQRQDIKPKSFFDRIKQATTDKVNTIKSITVGDVAEGVKRLPSDLKRSKKEFAEKKEQIKKFVINERERKGDWTDQDVKAKRRTFFDRDRLENAIRASRGEQVEQTKQDGPTLGEGAKAGARKVVEFGVIMGDLVKMGMDYAVLKSIEAPILNYENKKSNGEKITEKEEKAYNLALKEIDTFSKKTEQFAKTQETDRIRDFIKPRTPGEEAAMQDMDIYEFFPALSKKITTKLVRKTLKKDIKKTLKKYLALEVSDEVAEKIAKTQDEKLIGEIINKEQKAANDLAKIKKAKSEGKKTNLFGLSKEDMKIVEASNGKIDPERLYLMKQDAELYSKKEAFLKAYDHSDLSKEELTEIHNQVHLSKSLQKGEKIKSKIAKAKSEVKVDTTDPTKFNTADEYVKAEQLEEVNRLNKMTDDYHTGIRTVDDIKTYKEAFNDSESFVYPDFTKQQAQKALDTGEITIYSSKSLDSPSAQFVTPSKMNASDYAGGGTVYSKKISIDDVAWINGDEGQLVGKTKSQLTDIWNKENAKVKEIAKAKSEGEKSVAENIDKKKYKEINKSIDEKDYSKILRLAEDVKTKKAKSKPKLAGLEKEATKTPLDKVRDIEKGNKAIQELAEKSKQEEITDYFKVLKKETKTSKDKKILTSVKNKLLETKIGKSLTAKNKQFNVLEKLKIVAKDEYNELLRQANEGGIERGVGFNEYQGAKDKYYWRASTNSQWYRDYFKKNKRRPPNYFIKELAYENVVDGKSMFSSSLSKEETKFLSKLKDSVGNLGKKFDDITNKVKSDKRKDEIAFNRKLRENLRVEKVKKQMKERAEKTERLRKEKAKKIKLEEQKANDKTQKIKEKVIAKIKKELPKTARGSFLESVKNAKTEKDFQRISERITKIKVKTLNEVAEKIKETAVKKADLDDIIKETADRNKIIKNNFDRDLGVGKVDDILKDELPTEYVTGKVDKAEKGIDIRAERVFQEFDKLDLSEKELEIFYNFREKNGDLSKLSSKKAEKITELNKRITEMVEYLNGKMEKLGLLKDPADAETYIRTYLRNLDGTPASAEKIAKLRADMGKNFNDLMASFSQNIRAKDVNIKKRYANADLRDEVLKRYGLKTDRNLVRSMGNYIKSVPRLIIGRVTSNTIRGLAKSKKTDRLFEVYDPKALQAFRKDVAKQLSETRKELLKKIRESKLLSKDALKIIKSKEELIFHDVTPKTSKNLSPDEITTDLLNREHEQTKEQLKLFFSDIKNALKNDQKATKYLDEIKKIESDAKRAIREEYEEIALRRGIAEDKGFRELGVRGMESLRGVMGKELEYAWVQEIAAVQKKAGWLDNTAQSSMLARLAQTVGDTFVLGKLMPAGAQIKGLKTLSFFWNAITLKSYNRISDSKLVRKSEFLQTSRKAIGDLDTLKKYNDKIESELTHVDRLIRTGGKFLDKTKLKKPALKIKEGFMALENYQFDKVLTGFKIELHDAKVEDLMRKGFGKREAEVAAGKIIDTVTGVTNLRKVMARHPRAMSKNVQKGLITFIYSPNLTYTIGRMLKMHGWDIFKKNVDGYLARRAVIQGAIFSQVVSQSLSYALNGHSTFENEDKSKIFAVKLGNMKDKNGNQAYMNPIGWIAKAADFLLRPTESLKNKTALLPRLAINLLNKGYSFEKTTNSRIPKALKGVMPIPITFQGLLNYALNKDKGGYGVHTSFQNALFSTVLDFTGNEMVYSGRGQKDDKGKDKPRTTLLIDLFNKNELGNLNIFTSPSYIENYLLSRKIPTTTDILKDKYDITGSTFDDTFINAVSKMPEEHFELFISDYSEKTQKQIRKDVAEKKFLDTLKGDKVKDNETYYKEYSERDTELAKEINRLEGKGYSAPRVSKNSKITVDGEERELTAEEQYNYRINSSKKAKNYLDVIIKNEAYKKLEDKQKDKAIDYFSALASEITRAEMFDDEISNIAKANELYLQIKDASNSEKSGAMKELKAELKEEFGNNENTKKKYQVIKKNLLDIFRAGGLEEARQIRSVASMGVSDGERAAFIYEETKRLSKKEKDEYFKKLAKFNVLNKTVYGQIKKMEKMDKQVKGYFTEKETELKNFEEGLNSLLKTKTEVIDPQKKSFTERLKSFLGPSITTVENEEGFLPTLKDEVKITKEEADKIFSYESVEEIKKNIEEEKKKPKNQKDYNEYFIKDFKESYKDVVYTSSKKYGLPKKMLSLLMREESQKYSPDEISYKGARGPMQIMPNTEIEIRKNKEFKDFDIFNPEEAIPAGTWYLNKLYKRFGAWDLALAAYNAGPGNVSKYKGIPPFIDTQNYVKNIMSQL